MDVIELKITDYRQLLMTTLRNLSKTSTLTNIGFVSEAYNGGASNCILSVHKEICSGLFKDFNQYYVQESQTQYYFLFDNIRQDILSKAIDFMYMGSIDVINGDLKQFYKVLDILKLNEAQYSSICDPDLNTRFNLHHHDEYFTNLWYSRSEQECDVVFVTSDFLKLSAHSLILSGNSTYLLNIFTKNKERQKPFTFILENVKREQLESVIEFCYRGNVCTPNYKLREVFEVARLLGINALCEKILNFDPNVAACEASACPTDISTRIKAAHSSKQDNPSKNSTHFFSNIIAHEQLCDISLLSGNNLYRLHLAILIEFSPFFLNFITKCNLLKDSFVLMKDLNNSHLQSLIKYIYNGETEFQGSTKDFNLIMKDWINFEKLPISESIDCHILTSSKTRANLEVNGRNTQQSYDHANISLEPSGKILGVAGLESQIECENLSENLRPLVEEAKASALAGKPALEGKTSIFTPAKQPRVKKCHTCAMEFASYKLLAEHTAIHPEARIMKCEYCGKKFDRESQMNLHLRTHTGARPYSCSECGISFAAKSAAVQHRFTHSSDTSKMFVCDICKKTFSRKQYMKEHIRSHTGSKPYECTICHKKFVGRTGLNHHTKTHDRNPESVCEICGKSFTRHALWTHMKQHDKTHQCSFCHKYYPTNSALSIHIASTHHAERNHQCEVCGKGFVQKTHLDRHSKVHKQTQKTVSSIQASFSCEKCTKGFKSEEQLQLHMRRAHSALGEKPYACQICHKTFAGRSTAVYHQRSHTGELPFACSTCGKCFARPDTYRKHMRLHNRDSKPIRSRKRVSSQNFECHLCYSTYLSKSALHKHISNAHSSHLDPETISDHKPSFCDLTCSICNKTFKTAMQCRTHFRSHDNQLKMSTCAICSRSFRSESMLTKHMIIHTMPVSPARELPPIYTFQQCEPSYSNDFANGAFANNPVDHIQMPEQYNITGQESHPFIDDKSSESLHRRGNTTVGGNLCRDEGDKFSPLHGDSANISVEPMMLIQDSIELSQGDQVNPITSIDSDCEIEATPLAGLLEITMGEMLVNQNGGDVGIS